LRLQTSRKGACMCRVIFKNPNEPEQPAQGVYRWFYVEKGEEKTFYVGQAGAGRRRLVIRPSTLGRGVSELQRVAGLSSDGGRSLDTDFIVGTAIMYLTKKTKGLDCVWEHISSDPGQERGLCRTHNPILQDGYGRIRKEFKLTRPDGPPWKCNVEEAEERLYDLFAEDFRV